MIIYQVYPRSFRDANGDGIGDIPGIIEKLDYIRDLGVDGVWFNPFFKSPLADGGYDISDYCAIAPEYGTLTDFDELVRQMHARGLKVILDLVLNHTSDQHPWFISSASSRESPKRDWYIWRDGRKPGGRKPPNNWRSDVGGCAWRYFPETGQWAYSHFLPFEMDLNYRNPAVAEAMFNVMRFWLDRGVDGFRIDMMHSIYEDEALRDNPLSWRLWPGASPAEVLFQSHKYDVNQPETWNLACALRQIVDSHGPGRLLVWEVFGGIHEVRRYCLPEGLGLDMVFLFRFSSTPFKASAYADTIQEVESHFPAPQRPTYVLGNHDRMRFISRIGGDMTRAKLAAALQLTLRGVPFIYYGEEIGMANVRMPLETSHDPIARKYSWAPVSEWSGHGFSLNRENARTPMQWDAGPNAGFTPNPRVKPWLKVGEKYEEVNVARQFAGPASLFNCYRRLISLRWSSAAISEGSLELLEDGRRVKSCLAHARKSRYETVYVYLNFSSHVAKVACPISQPSLLFSTIHDRARPAFLGGMLTLEPWEGTVVQ